MNNLVKILTDDSGVKRNNPVWCFIDVMLSDPATLCTGEYFGYGQSGCDFKIKKVIKGGITCEKCLEKIKMIKAIKL